MRGDAASSTAHALADGFMIHATTFDRHAGELEAVITEAATMIGGNAACRASTFKLHWLHRRSRLADDDGTCDLRA